MPDIPHPFIAATLNQRTFLKERLGKLVEDIDPKDYWDGTEKLSEGRYKYFIALAYKGESEKAAAELKDFIVRSLKN